MSTSSCRERGGTTVLPMATQRMAVGSTRHGLRPMCRRAAAILTTTPARKFPKGAAHGRVIWSYAAACRNVHHHANGFDGHD